MSGKKKRMNRHPNGKVDSFFMTLLLAMDNHTSPYAVFMLTEEKPGRVQLVLITSSFSLASLNLGVYLFTNMHDFIEFPSNCYGLKTARKKLGNSLK